MGKVKQKIYCDIDFLLKFFRDRPILINDDLSDEEEFIKYETWRKFRNIFLKDAVINLNISADKFFSISHPFLDELKRRKGDGYIKLKFGENSFVNFQDVDFHSLFFLADNNKCLDLEEKYGLLFISNANYINRSNILFSSNTFCPIDINTNWSIMEAYRHPCNNIIIVDNYLFSKSTDVIKSNLYPLFKSLLPEKFKGIFKLNILSKKDEIKRESKYLNDNSVEKSIIDDIIKSLNLSYKVDVKFEPANYGQHDRYILTNYYLFDCGYGFVLGVNEKSKGTRLYINRITQSGVLNTIAELEEKLKKYWKN